MAIKPFLLRKGLDLSNTKIVNLAAPVNDTDAVNKAFAKNAANITEGILDNARLNTASTTQAGIVQLNNSTNSTSDTEAATPSAVKAAYDLANTANTTANAAIPSSQKGVANGVATLDDNGKIPSEQLPSYVDDVVEYPDFASLPTTGASSIIYVTTDNNKVWRWSGSTYVEIASSVNTSDIANKLATARSISMTGDVSWSVSFDGSQDVSAAAELSNTGVTSGTYTKVTVDSKGRVTYGEQLDAEDIPELDASIITSGTIDNARLNAASTTQAGIVQLNDSVTSTSTTEAATANAVKTVYDLVNNAISASSNLLPLANGYITSGTGNTNSNNANQSLDITSLTGENANIKSIKYVMSVFNTVNGYTQTSELLISKGTANLVLSEYAVVLSDDVFLADFDVTEDAFGNIELTVTPASSDSIKYSFVKTVVRVNIN